MVPTHTTVLEHKEHRDTPQMIAFTREPEDHTDMVPIFYVPKEKWRDLGRPQTITMHVVPGDQLNIGDGTTGRFILDFVPTDGL